MGIAVRHARAASPPAPFKPVTFYGAEVYDETSPFEEDRSMGYQIHLRREGGLIRQHEWEAAVEPVDGVRMGSGEPLTATHPGSGLEISIAGSSTDAEFYFPEDSMYPMAGQWFKIFSYSPRGISVNAAFNPDDTEDPIRIALKALASELGAKIVGDEGEEYEF